MNGRRAVWLAAVLAVSGCAAMETIFSPPPAPPSVTAPPPATASPPGPRPRARPAPLPPLQKSLGEAEEQRLREEAARHIAGAQEAARDVRAGGLQPDEREAYASVQSFIRQAQEALAARDYERAVTLARKAQALAQDLPRSRR